jgi:hypothetical protein
VFTQASLRSMQDSMPEVLTDAVIARIDAALATLPPTP